MSGKTHYLQLPLDKEAVRALAVGDMVMLSGDITISIGLPTHKRMVSELEAGHDLPLDYARRRAHGCAGRTRAQRTS